MRFLDNLAGGQKSSNNHALFLQVYLPSALQARFRESKQNQVPQTEIFTNDRGLLTFPYLDPMQPLY